MVPKRSSLSRSSVSGLILFQSLLLLLPLSFFYCPSPHSLLSIAITVTTFLTPALFLASPRHLSPLLITTSLHRSSPSAIYYIHICLRSHFSHPRNYQRRLSRGYTSHSLWPIPEESSVIHHQQSPAMKLSTTLPVVLLPALAFAHADDIHPAHRRHSVRSGSGGYGKRAPALLDDLTGLLIGDSGSTVNTTCVSLYSQLISNTFSPMLLHQHQPHPLLGRLHPLYTRQLLPPRLQRRPPLKTRKHLLQWLLLYHPLAPPLQHQLPPQRQRSLHLRLVRV